MIKNLKFKPSIFQEKDISTDSLNVIVKMSGCLLKSRNAFSLNLRNAYESIYKNVLHSHECNISLAYD